MQSRTGISRQQYQKLESQGNPRLETLEIIAAGLNAQLMLIPDDKVHLIRQLLNDEIKVTIEDQDDLMTNPWKVFSEERNHEYCCRPEINITSRCRWILGRISERKKYSGFYGFFPI
jgi:transcriptional regulator with XRE-family HTH domain